MTAWDLVIKSQHMATMSDYPYNGRDGDCSTKTLAKYKNKLSGALKITGYIKSSPGN